MAAFLQNTKKDRIKKNYVYVCLPVCISVYHLCALFMEARRGHRVFWNWSYRPLLDAMWVLGVEPGSSGGVASALNSEPCLQPLLFLREGLRYKYMLALNLSCVYPRFS